MEKTQPARLKAKLFKNGRSQAVRLPKEFRFSGDEVEVYREGERVILEPVRKREWPTGYWRWVKKHAGELELGDVEAISPRLNDLELDED